jgi:enoyl-[acyl-carrier protein] reductase II
MAAAFALGAEGVQMGTRMVSAAESPVHENWKNAIIDAKETDTVFLNRHGNGPALRALRTERTKKIQQEPPEHIFGEMANALDLYFGGDMEAAIALSGQVAGRIDSVKPVKQIVDETILEFHQTIKALAAN